MLVATVPNFVKTSHEVVLPTSVILKLMGKISLSPKSSVGLGAHFGSTSRGQSGVNWMLVQNKFGSVPCQCCLIDVVRGKTQNQLRFSHNRW